MKGWLTRAALRLSLGGHFRRLEQRGRGRVPAHGPLLFVAPHPRGRLEPVFLLTVLPRSPRLAPGEGGHGSLLAFAAPGKGPGSLRGAAGLALDLLGSQPELSVVPVALHFSAQERFRSDALVDYGPPLPLRAWLRRRPRRGAEAALARQLKAELGLLALDFDAEKEARSLLWAARLLATDGQETALGWSAPHFASGVDLARQLLGGLPRLRAQRRGELRALLKGLEELRRELRRLRLEPEELFGPMRPAEAAFFILREAEILAVGLPLAVIGALGLGPPFELVRGLAERRAGRKEAWIDQALYPSLIAYPCWALCLAAVLFWRLPWSWALAALLLLGLGAGYTVLYLDRASSALRRALTFARLLFDPPLRRRLEAQGRDLIARMRALQKALPKRRARA